MKIKQSKGYRDTIHTEVVEPLTLEDFIIEEAAPFYSEHGQYWYTSLMLTLKDEVAENIAPVLANRDHWSPEKGKIVKTGDHYHSSK